MAEQEDIPIINLSERQIQKYIARNRPPEELRNQLDIGYSYDKDIVEIFELRPNWNDITKQIKIPKAKARFSQVSGFWKVYWMPANGKWKAYEPSPEVSNLSKFIQILEEDKHSCFWG